MILLSFAAIALLSNVAIAVPYNGLCDATLTCTEANNVCGQQSACTKGLCTCAPGYIRVISTCEPEKLLGDSCTTYCSVGSCTGGTCQCRQGFTGSSDRRQCIGKALGETCTTLADCQGAVVFATSVTCNRTCQCATGYKPYDTNNCIWHSDGDACTPGTTQCSPQLASCSNTSRTCTCDTVAGTKYEWMTYSLLGVTIGGCVHPSSTKNVGYGQSCTVNNQGATARFCADNYLCSLCPENTGTQNYECLSLSGVGQMRASSLAIVTVLLLGIKIALFTA